MSSPSPARHSNPSNEYIDLVEVSLFVWRARVFILLGAMLGVALGWTTAKIKFPKLFVSSFPLVWGGEAADIENAYISNFNRIFRNLGVIEGVFKDLEINSDSRAKATLETLGLDRQTFLRRQSGQEGDKLIPFKLVKDTQLIFETRFTKEGDEDAILSIALIHICEKILAERRESSATSVNSKNLLDPSQKWPEVLLYEKISRSKAAALDPIKVQMYAIESRLIQKLKSPMNFVFRNEDNVLWLLGVLLNSERLDEAEAQQISAEYAKLSTRLSITSARLQPFFKDANDAMIQSFTQNLFPTLQIDEPTLQMKFKTNSLKHTESKLVASCIVGGALGGLASLLIYGLFQFILQARDRLRSTSRT